MNGNDNLKIALLIDAENISYKYTEIIFNELKSYGNVTIKNIYGDLTLDSLSPWIEIIKQHALMPVQQFQNTTGKNSSDMALAIDAMDILYRNNVDIFCLASSDSDFTRLASRLRQEGKRVIGMGESKAPMALVNSCDKFIYLNVIAQLNDMSRNDQNYEKSKLDYTPIDDLEKEIVALLESDEDDVNIAYIKEYLQKIHPDFDCRNYDCNKFSKFMALFPDTIELKLADDNCTINANLKN